MTKEPLTSEPGSPLPDYSHVFQSDPVMSNIYFIKRQPFEPSVVPGSYRHKDLHDPKYSAERDMELKVIDMSSEACAS